MQWHLLRRLIGHLINLPKIIPGEIMVIGLVENLLSCLNKISSKQHPSLNNIPLKKLIHNQFAEMQALYGLISL